MGQRQGGSSWFHSGWLQRRSDGLLPRCSFSITCRRQGTITASLGHGFCPSRSTPTSLRPTSFLCRLAHHVPSLRHGACTLPLRLFPLPLPPPLVLPVLPLPLILPYRLCCRFPPGDKRDLEVRQEMIRGLEFRMSRM
jgi:hypothetical protein